MHQTKKETIGIHWWGRKQKRHEQAVKEEDGVFRTYKDGEVDELVHVQRDPALQVASSRVAETNRNQNTLVLAACLIQFTKHNGKNKYYKPDQKVLAVAYIVLSWVQLHDLHGDQAVHASCCGAKQ